MRRVAARVIAAAAAALLLALIDQADGRRAVVGTGQRTQLRGVRTVRAEEEGGGGEGEEELDSGYVEGGVKCNEEEVEKEKEEAEEKLGAPVQIAVAVMQMGAIGFVMALFYLVNNSDPDIRYYSWMIIGSTISIFSAVLSFQSVNTFLNRYVHRWIKQSAALKDMDMVHELHMAVDFAHMLFWFLLLQFTTAVLSGACQCFASCLESRAKARIESAHEKAQIHQAKAKARSEKKKHAKKAGDYGSTHVSMTSMSSHAAITQSPKARAKTAAKRGGAKPVGTPKTGKVVVVKQLSEDKLDKRVDEWREMNMDCFATLGAHTTAFASILFFTRVFEYTIDHHPHRGFLGILKAFSIIPLALVVTTVLFRTADALRDMTAPDPVDKRRPTEDEKEEIERQNMWNEGTEEAENDVQALVLSYMTVHFYRWWIYREVPEEGGLSNCVIEAEGWPGIFWLVGFCLFSVLGLMVVIHLRTKKEGAIMKEGGPAELREFKETCCSRIFTISVAYFTMCLSWTLLFNAAALMVVIDFGGESETGLHKNTLDEMMGGKTSIVGKSALALGLSVMAFVLIFVLDKIEASHFVGHEIDEIIVTIILGQGLLIGFAWEQSFDTAVMAVASKTNHPRAYSLLMAVVFVGIVVPAYRKYVMPNIKASKKLRNHFED